MTEPRTTDLTASLLANTRWGHALARQLVDSEEAAEDLVQETWLKVLHRAPKDPQRAGGWFATVLRNLARSRARSERRRLWREQHAARGEAIESTTDVIERVAIQRQVIDSVMELEEPYRRTILMRFFDDLAPGEIARRTGAPVSTVKTRLARGLEHLRRKLDASQGGDRHGWVLLLLPLTEGGSGTGGGALTSLTLPGRIAMTLAALLVVSLGIVFVGSSPDRESPAVSPGQVEVPPALPSGRTPIDIQEPIRFEGSGTLQESESLRSLTEAGDADSKEDADAPGKPREWGGDPLARAEPTPGAPWSENGPPGMVLVPGGRTKIGTDLEDLIKLFEEAPALLKNAGGFLAEAPRHLVDVDEFFLMTTEVTNEQYHTYVQATGAKPPHSWGKEAIDEARRAYLEAEGERRKAARKAGGIFEGAGKFEEAEWWAINWKTSEYSVPEALKRTPVVFVDYQDARGYAGWAGLRLPTEVEFVRAVRGDTDRDFPWNQPFVPGQQAATNELRQVSDIFPVGSFPNGASEQGVFDLAGNVWEWTSSRYVPYPGWRAQEFNVGQGARQRVVNAIPSWSPDFRVVKGGSLQNNRNFARCTTRGGFDRFQRASALGFRCAASVKPGLDLAAALLDEIPREILPVADRGPVEFDVNQVLARDRWHAMGDDSTVPGYRVITGYDYVLFTPVTEVPISGLMDFRKGTETDDLFCIGFLSTNQDLVEPALAAGTYLIAIRGRGEFPERRDDPQAALTEEGIGIQEERDPATRNDSGKLLVDRHLELDVTVDNFIFIDLTGTPVAAVPVMGIDWVNPRSSHVEVVDRVIPVPAEGEEGEHRPGRAGRHQEWLELHLFIKGESRQGVRGVLGLRFADGLFREGGWR